MALAAACSSGTGGGRSPATGPVDVPAPTATGPAVTAACDALARALPGTVGEGVTRRPVTGDATRTAAWGDPAITLACGTPGGETAGIDGALFMLGPPEARLSLLQRDSGGGNAFVTYGRAVTVEVVVPDAYDAQVLQSLLGPLVDSLPPT